MASDIAAQALNVLQQAQSHFGSMMQAIGTQPALAEAPPNGQAAAAMMVDSLAHLTKLIQDFGSQQPSSRQQQLQQEAATLTEELRKAEQLLVQAEHVVQQWHIKYETLKAQHERTLTRGGSEDQAMHQQG